MGKIRGTHTSPGIYTNFTDISYAAKSIGITTLGLVGETVKGPAFEPVAISSWTEFVQYFGGTSPDKYSGSKYPRYEAPYIAKEYLSVSDQLEVCRVLGLSGYNAGPLFYVCAVDTDGKKHLILTLRSRGKYVKYAKSEDSCSTTSEYDKLQFTTASIALSSYTSTLMALNGCDVNIQQDDKGFEINAYNYGQFSIIAKDKDGGIIDTYQVSLNPESKDYIYNVLGSSPNDGNKAAVYVEELYDVMLETGILNGDYVSISSEAGLIKETVINPICDPVADFVTVDCNKLKRNMVGQTFLCTESGNSTNGYYYMPMNDDGTITIESGQTLTTSLKQMKVGGVYMVSSFVYENTKHYVYIEYTDEDNGPISVGIREEDTKNNAYKVNAVKVLSTGLFYYGVKVGDTISIVSQMDDVCDYHEEFRCATTPWVVSEIKGDGNNLNVYKLFRFHTISDGDCANTQVKISISNIDPDNGTFDVYVRDYNDVDSSIVVLEAFKNVTLKKGKSNYIGLKIGTLDGDYELKSKYVMIEISDGDIVEQCVPCGFLGYPVRTQINDVEMPNLEYNLYYDDEIKPKKQYFGMSDTTGVDVDILNYKGKNAYTERYYEGYTDSFHLDSRMSETVRKALGVTMNITIDNDSSTSGITWKAVSPNNLTSEGLSPIIGSEADMEGTIYEDKNLRKFTLYPCGGFDGWDIYRTYRTTADEYKASKYKGTITNSYGSTFSYVDNPETLALSGKCITSDYYAFLAGANQFENPEKVMINLFATPGIDYVNNSLLCGDILDMIEESRGDTLYIMTTPDKPLGVTDSVDEMYTASDVTQNLDDSDFDTYYCATYYPWVKYYDKDNSVYINLPVTKDVLRNMADVDNKKYPWYAPAGIERGNVNCVRARIFSKLSDEDTLYDGRINPVKTFSKDGVKIWGNKTMYTGDTPMNRVNVVRLMLYMRKLIIESTRSLIFEPNDTTLKGEFEGIVKPILEQIQKDRGITAFRLDVSQTAEEMDAHELSCTLWVKPTPALEYIEINFMVTPQGVDFDAV